MPGLLLLPVIAHGLQLPQKTHSALAFWCLQALLPLAATALWLQLLCYCCSLHEMHPVVADTKTAQKTYSAFACWCLQALVPLAETALWLQLLCYCCSLHEIHPVVADTKTAQ